MIRALFAKVKAEAAWLALIAFAVAGAWLYVQYRQAGADRDDVLHRVEVICAGSGIEFAPDRRPRGIDCATRVASLVNFKSHTDELTAQTLAKALADHDARQNTDNLAARRAAEAAQSAALRMELADAQAERTNLVGADWMRAVNGVAGLRAPGR